MSARTFSTKFTEKDQEILLRSLAHLPNDPDVEETREKVKRLEYGYFLSQKDGKIIENAANTLENMAERTDDSGDSSTCCCIINRYFSGSLKDFVHPEYDSDVESFTDSYGDRAFRKRDPSSDSEEGLSGEETEEDSVPSDFEDDIDGDDINLLIAKILNT